MNPDAVVVGGGLFGSVITRALRSQGRRVMLLDDAREAAGSIPAACLMKPSWLTMFGSDFKPCLELLDRLYGVQNIEFDLLSGKTAATVHWVDPKKVLSEPRSHARVEEISPEGLVHTSRDTIRAPLVVVAAGLWANELLRPLNLEVPRLEGRAGVAFLWRGQLERPFIRAWAPYKQLVAFNYDSEHIWIGDGSSIKSENWTEEHTRRSLLRCATALGRSDSPAKTLFGIRPYVSRATPCYLMRHRKGFWSVNGGAKNGTMGAAWAAWTMLKEV